MFFLTSIIPILIEITYWGPFSTSFIKYVFFFEKDKEVMMRLRIVLAPFEAWFVVFSQTFHFRKSNYFVFNQPSAFIVNFCFKKQPLQDEIPPKYLASLGSSPSSGSSSFHHLLMCTYHQNKHDSCMLSPVFRIRIRTVPHVFERSGSAKKCGFGFEPKRKGKELINNNLLEKMCNTNNFISCSNFRSQD